jgi:MFS family permease
LQKHPLTTLLKPAHLSSFVHQRAGGIVTSVSVARSIGACLVGTFILRMASAVVGSTIQLYFGYIDRNVYPLSDTMRGIALALFFLPELVGSPVLGAWSDRLGRKWFMALGSIFGGVGVQISALTTNFGALVLTRLLGGLSTASAIPATLGYLSAVTSHSESLRGRVMGLFQIATLGGTIVGILAGGRLWDIYLRDAFTIDAIIYAISLGFFLLGIREMRPLNHAQPIASTLASGWQTLREKLVHYRIVFSSPTVLRFAPAWIAVNMVLGIWLNHTVSQVVSSNHHFSGQLLRGILANSHRAGTQISLYGALFITLFGVGVLGWSFVLARFRRTTIMLLAAGALLFLCAILFALNHSASLSDPLVPIYLFLALLALLILSGMMPAALTYLADVTEEWAGDRGAIMGLYTIFFGLGGFLGTLIGGPFADWAAIDGILLITVLLTLTAASTLLRLHQIESQSPLQMETIVAKEQ